MQIAIILIFSTVLFSTAFLLLVNSLSDTKSKEVISSAPETSQFNLCAAFSLVNACRVNTESSAPNCPVRPEGEEYFDGIISELISKRNDPNLAKLIINIQNEF